LLLDKLRTTDKGAGLRGGLESDRKPAYEIHCVSKRVYVTLNESSFEPPFKKREYNGTVLDKMKFVEGFRTSELVLYIGDDFATFSTFEMGEPFRIVLDLRKKQGPSISVTVPTPGGAPGPAPGGTGRGAGAQ